MEGGIVLGWQVGQLRRNPKMHQLQFPNLASDEPARLLLRFQTCQSVLDAQLGTIRQRICGFVNFNRNSQRFPDLEQAFLARPGLAELATGKL